MPQQSPFPAGNAGGLACRASGREPLGVSSQATTGKAEMFSFLCSCPPDLCSQLSGKVLMWNKLRVTRSSLLRLSVSLCNEWQLGAPRSWGLRPVLQVYSGTVRSLRWTYTTEWLVSEGKSARKDRPHVPGKCARGQKGLAW